MNALPPSDFDTGYSLLEPHESDPNPSKATPEFIDELQAALHARHPRARAGCPGRSGPQHPGAHAGAGGQKYAEPPSWRLGEIEYPHPDRESRAAGRRNRRSTYTCSSWCRRLPHRP